MKQQSIGLFTLVALVIGNMLGAGVFTTSGFALSDLGSPAFVLLAWFVGGLVALCGALSYGALARLMPVSGGEYYFLSRSVHPMAGFIAGWVSLWAGFTAAIAFAAITLETYLQPMIGVAALPANTMASAAIAAAAFAHGLQVRYGAVTQNLSVAVKLALITGFIMFAFFGTDSGQWAGIRDWRQAATSPLELPAFATALMWISFSYSGFNAAVYIASEAPDARQIVPRAIVAGTLITMVVYLLLNAIFVFGPADDLVRGKEDVAAIAALALGGPMLEILMRCIITLALFTSVSAMIMVGPRVYAQMAEDGLMPRWMNFQGTVPARAIAAQAILAIVVVWLTELRELLSYLGFTLALCTAATVSCLFILGRRDPDSTSRLPGYPWAPILFIASTLLFCALAATANPGEMLAALLTVVSAVVIYHYYGRRHQRIRPVGQSKEM